MQAVAYIRVSTDEQARGGVSLDAQTERLEAYCKMQGLNLVAVLREEGISGSIALGERPAGRDVLRLLKERKASHVVALKLDRLFRDAEDALRQTKAWDRTGVALHLVDMGGQTLNTASATGRFFLNVMAGFAELERNLIAERTTTALAHKKAHGRVYNHTPFGFDREGDLLLKNGLEQDAILEVRSLRASGRSLRQIAHHLTSTGVPTKQGGGWHASTVKNLITSSLEVA